MVDKYILIGKEPMLVDDLLEWAEWFETADRHVANTVLPSGVRVSTVFLGIDHSFPPSTEGEPILFETMIFGGEDDSYQERYSTWEEAEAGHEQACKLQLLKEGQRATSEG